MNFIPGLQAPSGENRDGLWFIFNKGKLLIKKTPAGIDIPGESDFTGPPLAPERKFYFGSLDGRPCYAALLNGGSPPAEPFKWIDLRALFGSVGEELVWVAGRANQLADWDQSHRFCGRCGSPTEDKPDERAKLCPRCGTANYPRLSPAVIVAVLKGDRILLARNKRFKIPMFSVLAGFVEPGETLEGCVEREVREEVGIAVQNIRYFGSQPWPFPNSLMIAFVAEYAAGEIRVDGCEIAEAGWYTKSNLPPVPSSVSIARRMIDWFTDSF
jgi:NAD+ diphosphatase